MIPPLGPPGRVRLPVTKRDPSPLEATACKYVTPAGLGTGSVRDVQVCPESEDV